MNTRKIETETERDEIRRVVGDRVEIGDEILTQTVIVGTNAADGKSGYRLGRDKAFHFGNISMKPTWEPEGSAQDEVRADPEQGGEAEDAVPEQ